MNHMRVLSFFGLTLAVALSPAGTAWSQITNGSFRGSVSDASGAAVPGASVKLIDSVSHAVRESAADASGEYLFPSVAPGLYDFTVSYQGFQTLRNQGVVLQVGQHTTLDFKLQPGELMQELNVTAQAPLLNTTNSTIGTVVDGEKVTQLPLNGRQFT